MPIHADSHAPLSQHDDPSPQESLRPSAKEQKRVFREQARKLHEKDWLAPAGSVQEKQLLKRLAKLKDISKKDRDLIYKWIDNPDEFAKRNALFWQTAEKSVLGPIVLRPDHHYAGMTRKRAPCPVSGKARCSFTHSPRSVRQSAYSSGFRSILVIRSAVQLW